MDKAQLKELLKTATGIHEAYTSENFKRFILPHLEKLATPQPLDPHAFATREAYLFAIDNSNREAVVYKNLLKFFHSQSGIMQKLQIEINKPKATYGIK